MLRNRSLVPQFRFILPLVSLLMLVACDAGNIVLAGNVVGSNSEPLSARLVVVFLNNQEVGRAVSQEVVQGATRRKGVFSITTPNAWSFSDEEFGIEGQREIPTFGIRREYSLLEGTTKVIKLRDHDAVFAIKAFSGEENLLSMTIRGNKLTLQPNQEVMPSTQPLVVAVAQTRDYFSRLVLAFAACLFTFTMAVYALPSIIPTRTFPAHGRKRGPMKPGLMNILVPDTSEREFVILGIAGGFSLVFAKWLIVDSAAENLINQLTAGFAWLVSLLIVVMVLAMSIPLLRRKNVLARQRKKLEDNEQALPNEHTDPRRKE